jgi:hypothetical protein
MQNTLRAFCIFILFGFAIWGCKKDNNSANANANSTTQYLIDTIPADLETFLDTVTKVTAVNGGIVLPDGLTVDSTLQVYDSTFFRTIPEGGGSQPSIIPYKDEASYIIAHMLQLAANFCDRSQHSPGADANDKQGVEGPAQHGLAYVSGAKDILHRYQAINYLDNTVTGQQTTIYGACSDYLYGLDCSGFVYQCLSAAELSLDPVQSDVKNLTTTLIQAALNANPMFQNVSIQQISNVTSTSMLQYGDIVYSNSPHIGIVGSDANGNLVILQCNGSFDYGCDANTDDGTQWVTLPGGKTNKTARGPNSIPASSYTSYFHTSKYTLNAIRLTTNTTAPPNGANWLGNFAGTETWENYSGYQSGAWQYESNIDLSPPDTLMANSFSGNTLYASTTETGPISGTTSGLSATLIYDTVYNATVNTATTNGIVYKAHTVYNLQLTLSSDYSQLTGTYTTTDSAWYPSGSGLPPLEIEIYSGTVNFVRY